MKLLKFLFSWCYNFDTPKTEDNEMTDEEAKIMNRDFDKLRKGRKGWFVKR